MRPAVGIVRVSETGGREEDSARQDGDATRSLHSPETQRELIREYCERMGWELLAFGEPELDVSGRLPLDRRPGADAPRRTPTVESAVTATPTTAGGPTDD